MRFEGRQKLVIGDIERRQDSGFINAAGEETVKLAAGGVLSR
jgi:hypothetical protein